MFKFQLLTLTCIASCVFSESIDDYPNCGPSELLNATVKTCTKEVFGSEMEPSEINFNNGTAEDKNAIHTALMKCFAEHLHVELIGFIKAEDVEHIMATMYIPNEEIRLLVETEIEKCISEHQNVGKAVMSCVEENTKKLCM